jgi:hypothetical protein
MATEAALQPPTWMDGTTVPAAELRRQLLGLILPQSGVVRGLEVEAMPTPDMRVRTTAGLAGIGDGAGGYYAADLVTTVDLDIAPSSSTLNRRDAVVLSMNDQGAAAQNRYRLRLLTGTPAASPSLPALPPADEPDARTLLLAEVYVRAGAESDGGIRPQDITDRATRAVLGGGDWRPLSLAPGIQAAQYDQAPAWRFLLPGVVQLRGSLERTDGQPITSGTPLAAVPAAARPLAMVHFPTAGASEGGDRVARPQVGADGQIVSYHSPYAPAWLSLRGIMYEVT